MEGYKHTGRRITSHKLIDHPGEEVIFKMKVLARHRSASKRQVTESSSR